MSELESRESRIQHWLRRVLQSSAKKTNNEIYRQPERATNKKKNTHTHRIYLL